MLYRERGKKIPALCKKCSVDNAQTEPLRGIYYVLWKWTDCENSAVIDNRSEETAGLTVTISNYFLYFRVSMLEEVSLSKHIGSISRDVDDKALKKLFRFEENHYGCIKMK